MSSLIKSTRIKSAAPAHGDFPWAAIESRNGADLAARLRRLIRDNDLEAGRPLPTEREMASRLSLSRSTIRRALKSLESSGLVSCRQGSGYRVIDSHRDSGSPSGLAARTVALITLETRMSSRVRQWDGLEAYVQLTVTDRLRQAGYHILTINPKTLLAGGVKDLVASRPAAVVLTSRAIEIHGEALVHPILEANIPTVTNSSSPLAEPCVQRIHDHAAGAQRLTKFLFERNHRRILPVFAGDAESSWQQQRMEGYRRAHEGAGIEPMQPVRIPGLKPSVVLSSPDTASRICMGFLYDRFGANAKDAQRVDAVMAATDVLAQCVAHSCLRLGVGLGDLPDITGYDLSHGWVKTPDELGEWKPAASVDKDNAAIGEAMSSAVEALISPEATTPDAMQFVPFRFVGPHDFEDTSKRVGDFAV
ncbi:MAG: GntR family transcriptional regulator [Planctomycetota bacterium]